MQSATTMLLSLAGGATFWTLCEYAAHRFAMHDDRSPRPLSATHQAHHVDPAATIALRRALSYVSIAAVAAPIWWLVATLAGRPAATVFSVTWWLGYGVYEQVHWRFHHRPPRFDAASALRRRHFAHHFGSPKANFGVTTSIWDRVFRTHQPVEQVQIPRRLAMDWVTGDDGSIRPEFQDSYRLAVQRDTSPVAR